VLVTAACKNQIIIIIIKLIQFSMNST